MIPSAPWAYNNFDRFNKQYFNGKLAVPAINISQFCICNGQECYGSYHYNLRVNFWGKPVGMIDPGVLTLATRYDMPEKFWLGTLLHEMIHMYVYTVMLKIPSDPHGPEFQSMARRIVNDGWDVLEETVVRPSKNLLNEEKLKEIISEVIKKITENL